MWLRYVGKVFYLFLTIPIKIHGELSRFLTGSIVDLVIKTTQTLPCRSSLIVNLVIDTFLLVRVVTPTCNRLGNTRVYLGFTFLTRLKEREEFDSAGRRRRRESIVTRIKRPEV